MENSVIEVNGQTIMSFYDALSEDKEIINGFFEDAGIINIKANDWYLMHHWLDVFKTIEEHLGSKTMFVIGKKILDNALFPPNIDEIHKGLSLIDVAYHMNHKLNGQIMFDPSTGAKLDGIGNYLYTQISEKSGVLVSDTPYNCDFDRGIITSMARRFEPLAQVILDESMDNRKEGGDSSTYLINW